MQVVAFIVFWLLISSGNNWRELLTGAMVALLASTLIGLIRRRHPAPIFVRWFVQAARELPWPILKEALEVLGAAIRLFRPVPAGEFIEVPGELGTTPRAQSARVLTTLGTCLTSNAYVIGEDRERGIFLIHRLQGDEPPEELLWRPR